jgi:hypothetical protein
MYVVMFTMLFLGTCWGTTWDPMKWKLKVREQEWEAFEIVGGEQKLTEKVPNYHLKFLCLADCASAQIDNTHQQIVYTTSCVVLEAGTKLLTTFLLQNPNSWVNSCSWLCKWGHSEMRTFFIGENFHHLVIRVFVLFRKNSGSRCH